MATLTRTEIEERLKMADNDKRLIIQPILTPLQIGDMSVDLRLGNQFIVFRLHSSGSYDFNTIDDRQIRQFQERQVVRFGKCFVLHPGMLTLASTFEYIGLPCTLEAQVEGRSSWARLGLLIATATTVEPGFRGVITLELSNVGALPICLYPGTRIAQLLLRETVSAIPNAYGADRKYKSLVGPEFSRLHKDKDMAVFTNEQIHG